MKEEKEKQLIANRIQTPDGTILWSRFGHDFVRYTDKNGIEYMIDGGNDYQRTYDERNLPEEQRSINLCVYDDVSWEVQRQVILRGTFDKDGDRIWVPLSKLSDDHLKNIIKDMKECCDLDQYNKDNRYEKELRFRKKNKISVPDHDYDGEQIFSIMRYEGDL